MTDIQIVHGDRRVYELTITDELTGDPIPLEGGNLVVTVSTRARDGEVLFVKSNGDGVDYQDADGVALLTIEPSDLVGITNDWHRLAAEARFWLNGEPQTPIRWTLRVVPSLGEAVSS